AWATVIGKLISSSIDPLLRSSDHKRMATDGTMKMKSSGMFEKKSHMSAWPISKNPRLKVR
ncbi:MAG: hypothetical protein ACYSP9_06565, partial [Planctomycetota bacterium]